MASGRGGSSGQLGLGYSGGNEGLEASFGDSVVSAPRLRRFWTADCPVDFFAGAWTDLFLGVFFTDLSDSRFDRAGGNFARRGVLASGGGIGGACPILVCADCFLGIQRFAYVDGGLLDRNRCIDSGGA